MSNRFCFLCEMPQPAKGMKRTRWGLVCPDCVIEAVDVVVDKRAGELLRMQQEFCTRLPRYPQAELASGADLRLVSCVPNQIQRSAA